MKIRRRDKRVLGGVLSFAYLSGLILFFLSRWVRVATPVGQQHHPSEITVRAIHAGLAYLLLVALGYLVKSHVIPGLRVKKRMKTGITVLSVFGILSITALGILYSGEGDWNRYFVQYHDWIGLFAPCLIFLHAYKRNPQE